MALKQRVAKEWTELTFAYSTREDGSMATMFGVSAFIIVMMAGAVIDINRLYSAKSQAQLMGDNIGLMATIYVKNNDGPPQDSADGFINEQWYDHKEKGLDFGSTANSDVSIKFKVTYDDVNEEATVVTRSVIKPLFASLFGSSEINVETASTIKYAKKDFTNPASVFLVMDNSGSMAFDDLPKASYYADRPADAKPRIDGMKASVKDFVAHLATVITPDPEDTSKKYLRMGMTAFSSNIISSRTVNPFWGTLSNSHIDAMIADGGTNPTNSLSRARTWMQSENIAHESMNGSASPLKYVVLMTDGSNSSVSIDSQSQTVCTQLKSEGVEIFTIGFALEPGNFYTGQWGYNYGQMNYYISPTTNNRAKQFLSSCASSSDHYLLAEDADELKAVFDKIGKEITEDAIRIAS